MLTFGHAHLGTSSGTKIHIYLQKHTHTHTQNWYWTWLLCGLESSCCASKQTWQWNFLSSASRHSLQMLPGVSCLSSPIFTVSLSFKCWDCMLCCSFFVHYSDFHKEYWATDSSGVMLAPTSAWNTRTWLGAVSISHWKEHAWGSGPELQNLLLSILSWIE